MKPYQIGDKENILTAGTYYIGDPSFIINDQDEIRGDNYFTYITKHGCGDYKDNKGNNYFIDSGQIGIFPIEMIDDEFIDCLFDDYDKHAHFHTFDEDFVAKIQDGVFDFGGILIDTNLEIDFDFEYDKRLLMLELGY